MVRAVGDSNNIREEELRKQTAIRIKKMRRFLRYTREDIAAYLGITREQYKDIEMGRAEPQEEQLEKLKDLDFDLGYILTGTAQTDNYFNKALSVMPDKEFNRYIGMLETTVAIGSYKNLSEENRQSELDRIRDYLKELAEYGRQNYDEKELRELPVLRVLSENIDTM